MFYERAAERHASTQHDTARTGGPHLSPLVCRLSPDWSSDRCTIGVAWHTLGGPYPDHWVYLRPPRQSPAVTAALLRMSSSSGAPTSGAAPAATAFATTTATTERQRQRQRSQRVASSSPESRVGATEDRPTSAVVAAVAAGADGAGDVDGRGGGERLETSAEGGEEGATAGLGRGGRGEGAAGHAPGGGAVGGTGAREGGGGAPQDACTADPFELFRGKGVSFQVRWSICSRHHSRCLQ